MVFIEILIAFVISHVEPLFFHVHQGFQIYFTLTVFELLDLFLFDLKLNLTDWGKTFRSIALNPLIQQRFRMNVQLRICDVLEGKSLWLLLNSFIFDIVVLLNVRVESVLYFVLRTAWNLFTDFRPFTTDLGIQLNDLSILFIWPLLTLYLRIEFINKSFPDLFSSLRSDHLRKKFPILPHFFYEFFYGFILLSWPDFPVNA